VTTRQVQLSIIGVGMRLETMSVGNTSDVGDVQNKQQWSETDP